MQERNIEQYAEDYMHHDFESVMVKYRRKNVLKSLNKFNPKRILEIGCGSESIFNYYNQYDEFTVIEPSPQFCDIALKSPKCTSKVEIINGFLEEKVNLLEKRYDFIICSCLLHEVKNPLEFLEKIKVL